VTRPNEEADDVPEVLLVDFDALFWRVWHSTKDEDDAEAPARRTVAQIREWSRTWERLAVCHDVGRTWRHELSSVYKANREAKPEHARAQRRNALEMLTREGFLLWAADGFEADDVIASACRALAPLRCVVATADKDLHQLVSPRVVVLAPDGNFRGEEFVREKFGVPPSYLGDWLAIVGDASDNVAGVDGIGPKGATALLQKYGSLLGVIDAARDETTEIKPKARQSLLESEAKLALAVKLVTLREDVTGIEWGDVHKPRRLAEAPHFERSERDMSDETETQKQTTEQTTDLALAEEPAVPATTAQIVPIDHETAARPLAPRPAEWQHSLEPQTIKGAYWLAERLNNSRLFAGAFSTPDQMFAAILLARSHGVETMKVLMPGMVHNIKGKLTMSAQMIVGLVLRSGKAEYFECVESTAARAVYVTKRRGGRNEMRLEFTIEEARAAGYLAKQDSAWQKTPETMLRHRCETELARMAYPDVVGGLYSPEEMIDADARPERAA
jgi:5'-3' exonuclease